MDELIAICTHYRIDLDPLLNEAPSFNSLVLDNGNSQENPTKLLLEQLRKWSLGRDTQVLIDQQGPFVHAFLKPELAAFIMFYEKARSHPELRFDIGKARLDPRIISLATRITGVYRSLHRIELWRPNMFDGLLSMIHQCAESNRFSTDDDALRLCKSLRELLPLLEERYRSRLDKTGDRAMVCIAENGLSTDAICVRSGERYSLYRGRWYGEWTLTYSEQISHRSFLSMRKAILEQNKRTAGRGAALSAGFFNSVERKIRQTRRNIEQQVLSGA